MKARTWWGVGAMVGVLLVGGEASGAFGLDAILPPAARIGMVTYLSGLIGAYVARERFWWPALTVLAVVWIVVASMLLAIVDAMGGMTAGEMLLYNLFGIVVSAVCVLAGVGSGILLAQRGQERSGVAASGRKRTSDPTSQVKFDGGHVAAEVTIDTAQVGDEDALSLVGQATFLETFAGVLDGMAITEHCRKAHSPMQYLHWLHDARSAMWLARATPGRAPVGYLVVTAPDLPGADVARDLELKRIYLLGRYQGGGLGKRLLGQAIEHARRVGAARLLLGVYAGNQSAIAFYARQGFTHLAERQFVVGGTAYDDHVMSLALGA